MKFVSKHAGHTISIEGGSQRPVLNREGVTTFIESAPVLQADFKLRVLSAAEIDAAKEQIFAYSKDGQAFGAVPSLESGLIGVEEGVAAGYGQLNYEGYDPYQGLSVYDTDDPTQCPPDRREEVEAFLLACPEFNVSYVRVDNWNLQPPWPTYSLDPDVKVDGMVKLAQASGFLVPAINYEKAGPRRANLIAAYEKALAAEQAEAVITEDLSATV